MKKVLFTIASVLMTLFLFVAPVLAYTKEDVATHKTTSSCWVIFDSSVYDITKYVAQHDEYLNIRSWCGTDMTADFQTKDGSGVDHKNSSYSLLEQYKIGTLEATVVKQAPVVEEPTATAPLLTDTNTVVEEKTVTSVPKEYNLIIPLLATILTYWISYILMKKNKLFGINMLKFNAFWNTLLFLTLLVPAFGFGIFMLIRIQKPSLMNIAFDFKYWHVELSIVMGVLGLSHLIQRLGIYLRQLNLKK